MQPRLTVSALSTWYVVTDLLTDSYQYLRQFSFTGSNVQKSDNHERGSYSRDKGQTPRIAPQEDKPAHRQMATHEPDTHQQARETTRIEGRTARQDRADMAEIGRKGDKTAGHRRTPVASKPARKTVKQNRMHMAEIGRKGGEKVSQNREHMAEIGRKGGETISQDREHMAEIGHKGHENTSSERKGQNRTKGRNGKQAKSDS